MIKVTIFQDKKLNYYGFDVKGHAGYADAGHDIICAAVSMLVINTINAIEAFTKDNTTMVDDEDQGSIEFRFPDKPSSKEARLLLDTMVMGLESIEDVNGQFSDDDDTRRSYVDIIYKEV